MSSFTKRIRLDVDTQAINSLEQALPAIYNLREPQTPVKFYTLITTTNVSDAIGKYIEQNTRISLPLFVIRRQSVSIAPAEYLNNYAATTKGIQIGITEDRQHAIMVFPVRVKYTIAVTLLTDNFDILDHFIKVMVMYCKNEVSFGDVSLDNPIYAFPVRGTFGENYEYPDFTPKLYDAFAGFELNANLELSTFIVDMLCIPTIGQVSIQPVIVNPEAYKEVESILTDDTKIAPYIDTNLTININLRTDVANPAKRD